jgi:hypothetical protein
LQVKNTDHAAWGEVKLFDLPEEKEVVDELCIRVMDEDRGGRQVDFQGRN